MQPPRVTVIIPNYNHARFLEERIQSVLGQTYQNFEVLLLDDASTDYSRTIIAKYADDPRVQVVFNVENSGSPFKQWNKGVRLARGEFVWIAESDDYADTRLLEVLVPLLESNPNIGIAYCGSVAVDETGQIRRTTERYLAELDAERWTRDFIHSGKEECCRYLILKNTIPNASAVVFRKSVYEAAGFANEEMKLSGDWMLWVRMLLRSDVAFCAEPLNFFRQHGNSVRAATLRNGLRAKEGYLVLGNILNHVRAPEAIVEEAYDMAIERWLSPILSRHVKMSWRQHLDIYRAAKEADPRIIVRLLRRLRLHLDHRFRCYISRLFIIRVARRLRRILAPQVSSGSRNGM